MSIIETSEVLSEPKPDAGSVRVGGCDDASDLSVREIYCRLTIRIVGGYLHCFLMVKGTHLTSAHQSFLTTRRLDGIGFKPSKMVSESTRKNIKVKSASA